MIDTQTLIAILGLVGMVIVGGALLAGPVERSGLPALAVFLLLGVVLGPIGFNLIQVQLTDPLLRVVATLSLTLVLFTDAMTLDLGEVRRNKALAALILGPGTLLAALGFAFVAWFMLALDPIAAMILGAAVASTDPVVLRGMRYGSGLPDRLHLALRLESGMNDVMLLPLVVIALAFSAAGGLPPLSELARLLISLFVLGPAAGALVAYVAVRMLVWVRAKVGVRREYEALYVIGVALSAFAAAEALGGSGFLAAFAAGVVVTSLDVELCDCFLEYGQVTAEMALLFTYVLLGVAPIWSGLGIVGPLTLIFAAIVLLARLPIFALALKPLGLSMRERLTLGWYGPRGLGSLLLALLAVFAGLPAGEQLVAITSLCVLVSVALQGGWPVIRRVRRGWAPAIPVPSASSEAASLPVIPLLVEVNPEHTLPALAGDGVRISPAQVHQLIASGQPVLLLDTRSERAHRADAAIGGGALHVVPEQAIATMRARGVPTNTWLIAACT
ncbi:MAG: cation:proton antiporter [Oscillochloridaceae bacterium umkhey_bin13]